MKRLQTDLFDATSPDADAAPELGWLPDAWRFSVDDAASIRTAAPIVDVDGGREYDPSAADVASSMALVSVSDVFASLAHPATEPAETADIDVGRGSGALFLGQWQQEIGGLRLTDTGPGADDEPTQGNSCAAISVLSPPPTPLLSSSTQPAILANVANSPPAPNGASISNPASNSNLTPANNQSIGTTPDLKFVGPDGPEPVVDNPGTVGSSHSGPAEGPSIVSASSGINISQVTTNADGSITETVAFAGSGIVFNDTFETSVTQAYKNCILSAEQTIASEWTNSVTINEEFTAQAEGQNGDLASNEFYVYSVSYATLKSALTALASQEPNDPYLQQAVAHLPSTDPSGGAGFELALPYARMLGLTSSSENPDDIVTLNTSYNWSYGQDVINTVEHEISEGGMGRIGGLGDQNSFWSVMDLFRYNSSGVPDYSDGRDGQTTYFSFNGGATLSGLSFNNEFNSHGQQVNGGDTADFVQQDVFGTGDPGETNTLSQTDIEVMEALGWDPPPQGPVVTASNVTLNAGQASVAASSLFTASDPNGDPITEYGFMDSGPGHFVLNGITEPNSQEIDITAAQLSELTYQSALGTIDKLQIRAEDATGWGNWASLTVTAPPLVIQTDTGSFGSTSLTQVADEYFLDNSGGSGPVLKAGGVALVAGEVGGWVPIGAVQTASGYEVAWKLPSADEFSIWTVDSNGNETSASPAPLAANSPTLESAELTFHQDLNGDGIIGFPTTVIQTDTSSFGSTSLTQVGDNYFLYDNGSGPVLKAGGVALVAGEVGGWVPIGAVQTAGGYEIAWKLPSADEFSIWTTDSNGNETSASPLPLAANSYALESAELTFNQDLNGDGVIGPTKTVIQTDTSSLGSTSLTQVADEYFLYNTGGSGPVLKAGGVALVAGEVGGWVPIDAVQTASGYEVAWKLPSADEFSIWTVDSNGNETSANPAPLAANSPTLESAELTFNQDLNGDGTIGPPTTVIQTDRSISLTQVGDNYFLYDNGSGPVLKAGGVALIAGEVGGWVPIGAVQTAGGYEVAWKLPSADEFSIWTTDSNGNETSASPAPLAANSYALESAELTFNQDLNGDGTIGPTMTVIQTDTGSFGSTSLTQVANEYFLNNSGGSGPVLKAGGVALVAGEVGGWVPIGAVQTASGYEVAWKLPSADEFSIWTVDSNGNETSASPAPLAANSPTLESAELTFNQDLNGDGTIGPPSGSGTAVGEGTFVDRVVIRSLAEDSFLFTYLDNWGPGSAAHSRAVTVGGQCGDSFLFKSGFGVGLMPSDAVEGNGPSPISNSNQLEAAFHEGQTGPSHSLFEAATGGRDSMINGEHEPIPELHGGSYIVHPPIIG